MPSIHQFQVTGLEGQIIDFAEFAGKKILVVNVASKCGFTPQYKQLEELYNYYSDRLVVVGFPCNDFGWQEPGNATEIRDFCQLRYGVTFPLTEKVSVKGSKQHPVYNFLTHKSENGHSDSKVSWNFQKYLLDEQGQLLAVFSSSTEPLAEEVLKFIE